MDERAPVTKAALAYVRTARGDSDRPAYWFDVSAAYDAGMKHGAYRCRDARNQLESLRSSDSASGDSDG